MNKKKLIGKAALLLSLPMILGAVDGLKTSYAVEEGRSVVQIKEDSTKTGHSTKNENKKVNKVRYKVITWLQGLTGDKDYSIEKVIEREGKIGDLTYHEAPEIHTGFEFVMGDANKSTIASDGSTIVNLYYDRVKHSLIIMKWDDATKSFKQAKKVELKYGESTEDILGEIINDEKGDIKQGIYVTSNDGGTAHIHPGYPNMKNEDLVLYVKNDGKVKYTTIYKDEKGNPIHKDTFFFSDGNNIPYREDDAMDISGYTPTNPSRWTNIKGVHWELIFYTTNTYEVSLFNRGEKVKTYNVKYGEEIGKVDKLLDLPKGSIEEINGENYQFAGWYDNPEFKDNAESGKDIDIAKLKMPAHNMAFFAKWTPLNDDKKEEEPEQQDDTNSEIHKEEEKAPDKETTPPATPDKPQDTPPNIPEEGKEDNQDKGEDSDKEMNDDNSKENEGKEENKEESEKPKEDGKIEDEEGSHKEDSEDNEDESSEDDEEIEENEEESEEDEDEDSEDDEEIEEEDEDSEDEEEIESDREDEDDPQSDEPQDNDKKNEDTSKDKEKNNNSDKKEPQKDDKESDKIDDQSKNNDKDESKKEDSKEDKPESKDEDKKDTEEESEDDEDNSEIEEDEEESEEEEDEENEEDSKEKTDELESLRKAKYACLYDKLKTALDKYKVAIENLKKYKEKCIKDGESEDYIQKIDDVLEHANRLIKRGDNLLNRLEKMK